MDIRERKDIPEEFKWDLNGLFPSEEEWEAAFASVDSLIDPQLTLKGKLAESPDNLAECIRTEDELSRKLDKVYTYAHLKADEDTANTKYMAMQDRVKKKYIDLSAKLAWIKPEILAMDEDKLNAFRDADVMEPYRRALDLIIRDKPHTLNQSEERLLVMAAEPLDTASRTFGLLNNADLKFPKISDADGNEVELTHGNYIRFLESKKREVRKGAFTVMYETYSGLKNTLSSTLSGNINKQIFYSRARNHESALKASLHADNVSQDVYDSLIEAVHRGFPMFFDYVALRKKCLGLDTLDMYDQYVPIVPDFDMEVPYEQACEWVRESVKPLGDEYCEAYAKAFNERWIDVYENRGKRSGAYSSGCYDSNPYILMNYQGNLNSVFTLAHEMGHSLHSYFSAKCQPHIYSQYRIFVAEVASTVNEALLSDYLMKNSDSDQLKAFLLNEKCDSFKGTVYRQTMFAEFEKIIHEKAEQSIPLTPDELCQTYYELNKQYYGPDVDADKLIKLEWSRIPHFYYNFYVYKYATGFSAAEAFSRRILSGDADAVTRYVDFLKAGGSKDPLDVLADAGVDLRDPAVIQDALTGFGDYVAKLRELLQSSS